MSDARILRNIASKITVSKYLDHKEYLAAVYLAMKEEMDSYSYVQFARDLGFSASNVLYLIIKGQRPLTQKTGRRIADALDLKGTQRKYWDDLVAYFISDQAPEKESLFEDLVEQKSRTVAASDELMSQLEFFKDWYHGAIYELSFTGEFSEDPQLLAASLVPRIRVDQAKKSLALLQKLGLLAIDAKSGRLKPTRAQLTTGHEISSMAIVRYHQKMLELAKQALLTIGLDEREISATSVAIKLERMPEIKREIRDFRKRLMDLAASDSTQDQVYQMNIQFFPTTRKRKKP